MRCFNYLRDYLWHQPLITKETQPPITQEKGELHLAKLPQDAIVEIFMRLDARSVCHLSQVSRCFRVTLRGRLEIWEKLFYKSFPALNQRVPNPLFKQIGYQQLINGRGWDNILLSPPANFSRKEKLVANAYRFASHWAYCDASGNPNLRNLHGPYDVVLAIPMTFVSVSLEHLYTPLANQQAQLALDEFKAQLNVYEELLEKLGSRHELWNDSELLLLVSLNSYFDRWQDDLINHPRWTENLNQGCIEFKKNPTPAILPSLTDRKPKIVQFNVSCERSSVQKVAENSIRIKTILSNFSAGVQSWKATLHQAPQPIPLPTGSLAKKLILMAILTILLVGIAYQGAKIYHRWQQGR
jgi:hypothetical protein